MSMISTQLSYVLFSVPFFVAAFVLVKARLAERAEASDADYERVVWPEQIDEPEADERPVSRSYISYSS